MAVPHDYHQHWAYIPGLVLGQEPFCVIMVLSQHQCPGNIHGQLSAGCTADQALQVVLSLFEFVRGGESTEMRPELECAGNCVPVLVPCVRTLQHSFGIPTCL